jgi:hypothetical protein
MKFRILFLSGLLAFVVAFPSLPPVAAQAAAQPAPEKKDKTDLEKVMDQISKAAKALKKQINDPAQNASSLDLVATIRSGAEKALTLTPDKASDLPEADRPKFATSYRDAMKEFIASVDKLAAALKTNDNAAAASLFKASIDLERKDHRQYRRPEKD